MVERQFVMVAQKQRPLAGFRDGRSLFQNFHDGQTILHAQRHEQSRHQRKMKRHVAFIAAALAKIGHRVLRPQVGLGEQHPVAVFFIHMGAQRFEEGVGFRQVFAGGAFAFIKIRHCVQAQAVHAKVQPEIHHLEDLRRALPGCQNSDPAGAKKNGARNSLRPTGRASSWKLPRR